MIKFSLLYGRLLVNFFYWLPEHVGNVVQKHLRIGRGIVVPKFGIFTFTFPEMNLSVELHLLILTFKGTTNEQQRNKEPRKPVFLINKEFAKGTEIKPGIYTDNGLTPYAIQSQSGKIQLSPLNFTEIAQEAQTSKDNSKVALVRILREILLKIKRVLLIFNFFNF
jgi:hypothetical protein